MAAIFTRPAYGYLRFFLVCGLAISAVAGQNPLAASLRLPATMDSATSSRALPPETQTAPPPTLTYPDGLATTRGYVYDSVGNLIRKVNQHAKLMNVTDTLGGITTCTYNSLGQIVSITTSDGRVTRTQHDAVGRVIAHEDSTGHRTVYEYDRHGHLIKVTFPDGTFRLIRYPTAPRGAGAEERVQE